jgi:hypothetical protein
MEVLAELTPGGKKSDPQQCRFRVLCDWQKPVSRKQL